MLRQKHTAIVVALACVSFAACAEELGSPSDSSKAPATLLPEVRVTAKSDGSTEHSDSYAAQALTVGSKIPQSLRETPFSVSVITRQRLDDQNVTKIEDALKYTTGMTVTRFDGAGNANNITSRGFAVGSIQLDGLPISQATSYSTALDTAIYDRIEVLRGPAGLLQGAGEPGGTINLVRKRARAEFSGNAGLMLGSWNARRAEFDLGGKLVESGHVRARIVGVSDNRDSHVDLVKNNKMLGYGTLEIDLGEASTLSFGLAEQSLDTVRDLGLPTYANGTLINVPRSTFAGRSGNTQKQSNSEKFAELEHRLDNGGLLKLAAREVRRWSTDYGVRANGTVNAVTGLVNLQGAASERETVNKNLDAYISMPFEMVGQTQRVLFGLSYGKEDDRTASVTAGGAGTLNIFQPDYSLAVPNMVIGPYRSGASVTQTGMYGQVQLKPIDRWTLLLGGRYSKWDTQARNLLTGEETSAAEISPKFTPQLAAIYELNNSSSLYGSYAETFVAQTALDSSNKMLAPRTGAQVEFGIKSEFFNKRLNTQLAAFRILDKNRAVADPNDVTGTYSVAGGEVQANGWEVEVNGRLTANLDVTAGYAHTNTYLKNNPIGQSGQVFASTPKHNLNLWAKYSWRDGLLGRWSVAGGLRSVSDTYSQSGTVRIEGPGYTVVNAQLAYQINPATTLSLSVNNLFDKVYYEKISGVTRQNFYGAPRSAMLTLKTMW